MSSRRKGLSNVSDGRVVVEPRAGVAAAEQRSAARELGAGIEVGELVLVSAPAVSTTLLWPKLPPKGMVPSRSV